MGEILYYLEDFSDEVMPCAPRLDAWAAWLDKPSAVVRADGWTRDDIADGAMFRAYTMEVLEDINATRGDDGWTFDRDPDPSADFFALRYDGVGGWDIETATSSLSDFCEQATQDEYTEVGETIPIAVGRASQSVLIKFARGPEGPVCTVEGPVQ
jgi:hypothetical protein